jgi:hypothetical protein
MIEADVLRAPYDLIATRTAVRQTEAVDRMGAAGVSLALQEWKAGRATWTESGLPEETRERLIELSQLAPDWDSYGARRPAHRAIARSGTLISQVIARVGPRGVPQEIMPIADGGIQLEWRGAAGELVLNAAPDGTWSYLHIRHGPEGRMFEEAYGLTDADALALAFRVLGV